jgi:NAD+ kinase
VSDECLSTRVFILGNPDKGDVEVSLDELATFAESRCELVGAELGADGKRALSAGAERLIVLGGDGTLIGISRSLGNQQIPLIGVNAGKLGFLAEFSLPELKQSFTTCLAEQDLVSRRIVLQADVSNGSDRCFSGIAINDCVIQAGPPFRMITLGASIGDDHLTDVRGDGLIVCTPCGSTAHNLSAGGPILQPDVEAMVVTPLNPHSLTHKPLVIESDAVIRIEALDVNRGTTVIIDGQVSCPLHPDGHLTIRRGPTDMMIVRNPLYAKWHNLVTKLFWGQSPRYRGSSARPE